MNEPWFTAKLSDLRGHVEGLLAQDLTDDQRIELGAELHAHTETILDHFKLTGKMYRRQEG